MQFMVRTRLVLTVLVSAAAAGFAIAGPTAFVGNPTDDTDV